MMTESHSSKERNTSGFGRSEKVIFGKKRWEFGDINQPVQGGEKGPSVILQRSLIVRSGLKKRLLYGPRKRVGEIIRGRSLFVIGVVVTNGCIA
jgi:hypothetical protein